MTHKILANNYIVPLIVITIIIIFLPGLIYMHVTNFNLFIFIIFAITGILLAFVIKTYKKGTQVTREKW